MMGITGKIKALADMLWIKWKRNMKGQEEDDKIIGIVFTRTQKAVFHKQSWSTIPAGGKWCLGMDV